MASATHCPKCTDDDLLVVRLVPKDRQMLFHTCRSCEHRWWEDVEGGVDVRLASLIEELAS